MHTCSLVVVVPVKQKICLAWPNHWYVHGCKTTCDEVGIEPNHMCELAPIGAPMTVRKRYTSIVLT